MNRWKNFIALLLITISIISNSTIPYANGGEQNNKEGVTAVSGEGSGDASSDASGDTSGNASGEGQKEYVTISFYDDDKLVKTVQIEKGGTIEWWEPVPYSDHYIFKGWYYLISETLGVYVAENETYDKDINLYAYWEHNWKGPVDPINLGEKRLEYEKIQKEENHIRSLTRKASIKIKNITVKKKKGKLTLKIRSTSMPTSPIELQYSTSKKFFYAKTKTQIIKRTKNQSVKKFKKVTIKKLKKNKTYYIRARVKSEYNGHTYYSKWSKVQKVNMKGKKKQKK